MAIESLKDPFITTVYDCATGETIVRPMTPEEKQQLLNSGWTLEEKEETPTE